MLAVGRALMARPRYLLVDEKSLGLMPIAVDECYRALHSLQKSGLAILLLEQGSERAIDAADRLAIMESGSISWSGTGAAAANDNTILRAYLGHNDTQ